MKTFKYNNIEFEPLEKIKKREIEDYWHKGKLSRYEWLEIEKYNHNIFYEQAKTIGAEKYDIFIIKNGLLKNLKIMPCSNYLSVINDEEDNLIKICNKIFELHQELYDSKISLFSKEKEMKIYENNKNNYTFKIIIDFEKTKILFEVNNAVFKTINFTNLNTLYDWLKDKDKSFFDNKYNDYYLTGNIVGRILFDDTNLSELSKEDQETYLLFIYKHALYYIYSNKDTVDMKLKNFEDEFVEINKKSNEEILIEVKKDILNEINKEINYCFFDNVDYD